MSTEAGNEKSEVSGGEGKVDAKAPVVLISYSHDSDEHSQWVLNLATRLRGCGVDVLLDQWELGPGDDVPKFMERAVSESDRMLMICTEPYVRKADEGRGGVGYEAMIVTGELVKDMGTNKFIPVIRQSAGGSVVPKSVSTRFYVNLSDGEKFEEGLERLVREIKDTPKLRKPPLGTNPYLGGGTIEARPLRVSEVKIEDAESAYLTGCEIARSGDFKAWRELVHKVKEPLSGRLNEWRKKYDGAHSMEIAALPGMVLEAATIYSPMMALALAGVESGQEKFTKQTALLDEFLKPRDWNAAGLTVVGSIPEALVFTFQAVHGATCVETDALSLAMRLSRARISRAHHMEAVVLHTDHEFVGVPESFHHSFKAAWNYLTAMAEKWPWLNRLFGSAEGYQSALCGYYMALHIQELAWRIAEGNGAAIDSENLILDIPLGWQWMDRDVQQKAYSRLVESDDQTRAIWRSLRVSDASMAAAWPAWVEQTKRWHHRGGNYASYYKPAHATLFEDLRPEEQKP